MEYPPNLSGTRRITMIFTRRVTLVGTQVPRSCQVCAPLARPSWSGDRRLAVQVLLAASPPASTPRRLGGQRRANAEESQTSPPLEENDGEMRPLDCQQEG